ncbi:MAG: methyltransferase domain-containing protein [Desulfobacteraceae bacterium]|nr:methyltransferase domain-containing protein [Desulfobacteraceae bacterium]
MITVKFNRLNIQPSETILDIGCGSGRHVGEASRLNGVFVIGADRNHDDLISTRNRLNFIKNCGEHGGGGEGLTSADITALPFENETFHHVICSEVMEHIPDHTKAAHELVRVLKPGGNLVVSVPRYLPERICWVLSRDYYSANGGHVRIYRKDTISALFTEQGVTENGRHHYAHSIHAPFWWLKCLVGPARIDSKAVNFYHRFLTWDIMEKPKVTRILDKLMNPVLGKSLVLYFKKR